MLKNWTLVGWRDHNDTVDLLNEQSDLDDIRNESGSSRYCRKTFFERG